VKQKKSPEPWIPPAFVVRGLETLINSLERLKNRLSIPQAVVLDHMVLNVVVARCLYVVAELRIADSLRDGPRHVDDLARDAGVHPDALYRFMRTLASVGFFCETTDRCFASTRLSECLRADAPGSMLATAQYVGADWMFAGWASVMTTVRNGKTYHENMHDKSFFSWYDSNPECRRIFDDAMASMSTMAIPTITAAYDFSSLETIIDVGGGEGGLLAAILRKTPHLRGTLFDLPHVVARAEQMGLLSESEVAARVTMVGGDFFQRIPEGHDAYVLKWILHDWNDADTLRILENCFRAMQKRGTLLIVEMVLSPGNQHSLAKFSDIGMLALTGGRERTVGEYRELLRKAGFSLRRVLPTASGYSLLEAMPV
jgi:C-methyltransferase